MMVLNDFADKLKARSNEGRYQDAREILDDIERLAGRIGVLLDRSNPLRVEAIWISVLRVREFLQMDLDALEHDEAKQHALQDAVEAACEDLHCDNCNRLLDEVHIVAGTSLCDDCQDDPDVHARIAADRKVESDIQFERDER